MQMHSKGVWASRAYKKHLFFFQKFEYLNNARTKKEKRNENISKLLFI